MGGVTGIGNGTACFLSGTHIRTPFGEERIEKLSIGQEVVTMTGSARPVKWIGRRAYDPRFVRSHPEIFPIRIRRGALADDIPHRDLYISEGHALCLDGWLVQAGLIENGVSISRQWTTALEYFHIELDSHDVIFAEGAPAETYNDSDNRNQFQNAEEFWQLYPDHRPTDALTWAPRIVSGAPLDALRARLSRRALHVA